ncbi:hypothetical protein [Streptomyces sulphureus]|uniref:hypothetical protein n=1 Tax=Streptomyces sulphureus TaxID=47758 RepID=UPI00146DA5E5|nr:hypothetical protein [Streptomyces sulphureus]
MKSFLWVLLVAALGVNVFTSLAFDGVLQILLSVLTGIVTIGCVVGLVALRGQRV